MIQFKALTCRGFGEAEEQLNALAKTYTAVDVVAHHIEFNGVLKILVKCYTNDTPRVL